MIQERNLGGNKIISYQVVRIEQFNKGSLGKIGGETERTSKHHRNEDIDSERTSLNLYFKKSDGGLTAQWKKTMKELNATFREKKNATAFEGMIITSDTAFFKRLGWKKGEDTPYTVMEFFNRCYEFALQLIGYKGTDTNILSAVIHLDEKTPHLQLYYIPVVDTAKKKVYEKGADGKVLRNEKGSPIQKKDEHGKSVYEYVSLEQPKLCSSDFWGERGGQLSYGNLQDSFNEQVGVHYGLDRGEVGSNKKHTTKYQWQKQKQEAELASLEEEKVHAEEVIQEAQTAVATRDKALEELKPMQEYLDAFHEALSGELPLSPMKLRKMIVGLTTEYKRLEEEKKITDKDRENLFSELQKAERRIPELEKYKEFVAFVNEYAPDKLDEAKRTATERKNAPKPPFKIKSSDWHK
ncbi:MAG: plasmid recombination protein [Clostridia bacterium]|nr:plasmid recombination protein [Clostridia bacterium]